MLSGTARMKMMKRMSQSDRDAGEVLTRALALPCDQRSAYLDEACAGNESLRDELEGLLSVSADAEGFLEQPPPALARLEEVSLRSGSRVGPFTIDHEIGRGGMGTVYLARQSAPISRSVALKVVRAGMDSAAILGRFDAERRSLALMAHPNIARVLDAGATDRGLPWFALEHVEGPSLLQYAMVNSLDLRARIDLFLGVCAGVQHAHQRGIIHRDLKPANVLVAEIDGAPVPKIIDFGLAKALGSTRDGGESRLTRAGQFLGTPAYMSPEQAQARAEDVDTRTDVYALGVMLFELLTRVLPFEVTGDDQEMRRRICEVPPPRPSMRSKEWPRALRGDLDTITLRALSKDPDRRYPSVAALAEDLVRWRSGEAIDARRDSVLYILGHVVRRHRMPALLALTLLIAIAGAAIWSSAEARKFAALAFRESQARLRADRAGHVALEAEARANRDRDDARRMTEFLAGVLGMADPDLTTSASTTTLQLLEDAAARLEGAFPGRPQAEALLRAHVGRALFAHGRLPEADAQLREALILMEQAGTATSADRYAVLWPLAHLVFEISEVGDAVPRTLASEENVKLLEAQHPALAALGRRLIATMPADRTDAAPVATIVSEVRTALSGEDDPSAALELLVADLLQLQGMRLEQYSRFPAAILCSELTLEIYRRHLKQTNSRVAHASIHHLFQLTVHPPTLEEGLAFADRLDGEISALLPADHWFSRAVNGYRGIGMARGGRLNEALPLIERSMVELPASHGDRGSLEFRLVRERIAQWALTDTPEVAAKWRARLLRMINDFPRTPSVSSVRLAFGPEHRDITKAVLDYYNARTDEAHLNAAAAMVEGRRRVLPADSPFAGAIHDRELGWGESRFLAHGPDAVGALLAEDALTIAQVNAHLHPSKRARSFMLTARHEMSRGNHEAARALLVRAREMLGNSMPEHTAWAEAVASLFCVNRALSGDHLALEELEVHARNLRHRRGPEDSLTREAESWLEKLRGASRSATTPLPIAPVASVDGDAPDPSP